MDQILELNSQTSQNVIMRRCTDALTHVTKRSNSQVLLTLTHSSLRQLPKAPTNSSKSGSSIVVDDDVDFQVTSGVTAERRRKQLKSIISSDIKCSVCLHMFVKPITLVCGHT